MRTSKRPKNLRDRYGPLALVAGASEGLGAAFSEFLASEGLDLILIARREEPLRMLAEHLEKSFGIRVQIICCDLSAADAAEKILQNLGPIKPGLFVYNAAFSPIGPFVETGLADHIRVASTNMFTPLKLLHALGRDMVSSGRGGVVIMSSMAGLQGSGYLASYAASKAFLKILGEGLWFEWQKKGVDLIVCCAGATRTPGYELSRPQNISFWAPKPQEPQAVVRECFRKIGRNPSFVSGRANRIAAFLMQYLLKGKSAIRTMGRNTARIYGIRD